MGMSVFHCTFMYQNHVKNSLILYIMYAALSLHKLLLDKLHTLHSDRHEHGSGLGGINR